MFVNKEKADKLQNSGKGFEIKTYQVKGATRYSVQLKDSEGKYIGVKALKPIVDEVLNG